MSNFGGQQFKVSTSIARSSAASTAATAQATRRVNSVAAMPLSTQLAGNINTSCACGSAGLGRKVSTEVWDPFQFDCSLLAGRTSSQDLLRSMQQRRGQSSADACQPQPCPPRNFCDSGETDSSVSDNSRRTTEFLCDMFCQQKLCDVVLRCCGDGNTVDSFHAHKVQL